MSRRRPLFLALYLLTVIAAASAVVGKGSETRGSYKPIKDLLNGHVQEMANYGVIEHNHKAGLNLVYAEIVKGESQVVAGTNYRLVISAKDGPALCYYQAVVYEKSWNHFRNLTSFHAL